MFDAKQLLNVLTGGKPGPHAQAIGEAARESLDRAKEAGAEVASRTSSAVSGALGQAEDRLQGTGASPYIGKAREVVEQNPIGTAAALGGLAALLLGTKGGREATMGAVKLGGLAAIGGLAYKAYRNYQEGRPLTEGVPGLDQLTAAPNDSAFSEQALTHESALLLVRAMIATAAADGTVDNSERAEIVGKLKEDGLETEAAEFLDAEIQHPASIQEIARGVGSSKELALEVYAAARLVASSEPEESFLRHLAAALALDPDLIARLDRTALSYTGSAH